MVRQICSLLSEYFRGLVMQLEAEKLLGHEEDQLVRSKMLKRLSTMPEATRTVPDRPAASSDRASPEKMPPNKISPGRPAKMLDHAGSRATAAPLRKLTLDQAMEDLEAELEMSTSHSAHLIPNQEDSIMLEIGRQFSAITKEPSQRHQGRGPKKDSSLKRLSTGSAGRKKWISREFSDSIPDLLPPLRVDKSRRHDGRVLTQHLEDTTGVHVIEDTDYLVPKRSLRVGVADVVYTQNMEDQRGTMPASKPNNGGTTGDVGVIGKERNQTVLRTSLLLETMEEGEKETRIDGDGKNTFLVQTTMSEKETAIIGSHGSTILIPTSELGNYETTEQQATMDTEVNSSSSQSQMPAGSSGPPPPPPSSGPHIQPKPEPEPEPEVPMREPWLGKLINKVATCV